MLSLAEIRQKVREKIRYRIARHRQTPLRRKISTLLEQIPFSPKIDWLYFLQFEGQPPTKGRVRFEGTIRWASIDDLEALNNCKPKRATFEQRLANGDRCLIAVTADKRVVGYEWFSIAPIHNEGHWGFQFAIPPDTVYAYDAYVKETHRMVGLWNAFKSKLAELMQEEARNKILVFIELGNNHSFTTHFRFGFQAIRETKVLRFFGLITHYNRTLHHDLKLIKKLSMPQAGR